MIPPIPSILHRPSVPGSLRPFHPTEAAFDEEENEVRGTLVFKPPVEILPKTRRTEEMQRKKLARRAAGTTGGPGGGPGHGEVWAPFCKGE